MTAAAGIGMGVAGRLSSITAIADDLGRAAAGIARPVVADDALRMGDELASLVTGATRLTDEIAALPALELTADAFQSMGTSNLSSLRHVKHQVQPAADALRAVTLGNLDGVRFGDAGRLVGTVNRALDDLATIGDDVSRMAGRHLMVHEAMQLRPAGTVATTQDVIDGVRTIRSWAGGQPTATSSLGAAFHAVETTGATMGASAARQLLMDAALTARPASRTVQVPRGVAHASHELLEVATYRRNLELADEAVAAARAAARA